MKYYKVLVIAVGGANGTDIFNHGDLVPENKLPRDGVDGLISGGHIKEVDFEEVKGSVIEVPEGKKKFNLREFFRI